MRMHWTSAAGLLVVLFAGACQAAATPAAEELFLGIRCGADEACLERAVEMGLNTVLVNESFLLDPGDPSYPENMARLERVSRKAHDLGLRLFVGWHALGPQARSLSDGREQEAPLCISTSQYWEVAFAGPMQRVARALSGPGMRLDGFLPDVENYAREPVAWRGGCNGSSLSLEQVADLAAGTRREVRSLHPGLAFGLYPVRANEGRDVFWAWARGLSDPESPLLLLAEYTYSGYRPELGLQGKIKAYEAHTGHTVLLVPGFNVLKIPEPRAWSTHLNAFAKAAGGYWLYPGGHLVRGAPVGTHPAEEAFRAIREANSEIRSAAAGPRLGMETEHRRTPPHQLDPEGFEDLVDLAREVAPPSGVPSEADETRPSLLRTGDAHLLVQAGPEEPIELDASGSGYFGVYDPAGGMLVLRELTPQGISLTLPVDSSGVYPVLLKVTDELRPAEITVRNRFWSFRGVSVGTSGGRTARFLDRPGPGPFYFYVPEGTPFFRLFVSDQARGRFLVVRDPEGREALRLDPGYSEGESENARQDLEIPVPEGRDGRPWSIEGHPLLGLPRLVVYGVPDLFSGHASRLLTLSDRAWADRSKTVQRARRVGNSGALCVWIEAEDLWGGPWRLSRAFPGTSGRGAMFAKSFRSTLPLYGEIEVPHEGTWSVWVHALAGKRHSKRRSARICIGETLFEPTHRRAAESNHFRWESAGSAVLEEGSHILRVFPSPKGRPSVDAILLTDDARVTPEVCKAP